ncbi:hypothetical protein DUI87_04019 [Hirundo rustica rustica]|uniref:Uncharacterized protein n=1 Tax=Hirundo rustica rustica TaxID=333673 RepID=A0A3M0L1K9_HIRRU|nr:hypothetical protein DUI87_04019 [Hirundo rustica rustica]
MATPRSVEKEGQEVLQALSQGSSPGHGDDHGEAAVPLQPMGIHGGCRDPPAAHARVDGYLEEAMIQWETWRREMAPASRLEQPVPGRLRSMEE